MPTYENLYSDQPYLNDIIKLAVEVKRLDDLNSEMGETIKEAERFISAVAVYVPNLTNLTSYQFVMEKIQKILSDLDNGG